MPIYQLSIIFFDIIAHPYPGHPAVSVFQVFLQRIFVLIFRLVLKLTIDWIMKTQMHQPPSLYSPYDPMKHFNVKIIFVLKGLRPQQQPIVCGRGEGTWCLSGRQRQCPCGRYSSFVPIFIFGLWSFHSQNIGKSWHGFKKNSVDIQSKSSALLNSWLYRGFSPHIRGSTRQIFIGPRYTWGPIYGSESL